MGVGEAGERVEVVALDEDVIRCGRNGSDNRPLLDLGKHGQLFAHHRLYVLGLLLPHEPVLLRIQFGLDLNIHF